MFDLPDRWVWDFWLARDEKTYHLFFLKAPRSLGDPELRHVHASIGHAVSEDLRTWRRVRDAADPQPEPAFDDVATWTGSVIRADDGGWRMFTSGISAGDDGLVQRIGVSSSTDLLIWTRSPNALLEADRGLYATRGADDAQTHWRDPFVHRDTEGRWHLLATAQAPTGGTAAPSAVIAHAVSENLEDWQILPPWTSPSRRFSHAEVASLHCVDGRWVLLFSCLSDRMPHDEAGAGGVWSLAVPGPAGRLGAPHIDLDNAVRVTNESLYVGQLVEDPEDRWSFLAFVNRGPDGRFRGGIIDPLAVRWRQDGRGIELVDAPHEWQPRTGP